MFQNSKRMHKSTSTKRTEPKKLIQPATNNLNSIALQKYGISANFVEKNMQQNDKFCKIYDFHMLVNIQKFAERYKRNNIRQDDKKRKKLREPLVVCEKVFVLAERKKKDAPGVFYKSTTEKKPFLSRDEIFFIRRIAFVNNSYNYWISKTVNGEIINKRFLRQELFALKEQFI